MAAGEDDEELRIHAELEDDISAPAAAAEESIEDLGDEAKKTARKLRALEAAATRTGNSLALLAAKRKAATMQFADEAEKLAFLNDEYKRLTRTQNTSTRATVSATKATTKLGAATKKTKKEVGGFNKFLKSMLGIMTMTTLGASKLGLALGAVGLVAKGATLVPGLLGIVGSLASLLSLVSLLPTAILSLVAVMVTMKLATKGVGDAIGAGFAGDAAKFEEALKKLSPAARQFVKDVVKFAPQLKKLQQGIQESFFKPIVKQVAPAIQNLMPVMTKGTEMVSGSLGRLSAKFIQFVGSVRGSQLLMSVFRSANRAVEALGNSLNPLMRGFTDLVTGTEGHWSRLMLAFERGLAKFGGWLSQISQDGTLDRWLDMAFETAKLLFDILSDVGRIFRAIMVASDGGGLAALSGFLEKVANFLESAEGQQAIISFFDSLGRVSTALFPLLTMLATTIAEVLAPSIADIVVAILPGLVVFLQALSDGLRATMPMWGPLAAAIGELLKALAPILPVLGEFIAALGMQLAGVIKGLAAILLPFLQVILEPMKILFQVLGILFQAVAPYLDRIIEAFVSGFTALAPVLAVISQLFMDRFMQFLPKLIEHWDRMVPLIEKLAVFFGEYLVNALIHLLPHLPGLIDAFFKLLEIFVSEEFMSAFLMLLNMFIQLTPLIIDLIPYLLLLTVIFINIITFALQVAAVVISVFTDIRNFIMGFVMGLLTIGAMILDFLTAPFRAAFDVIKGIVEQIAETVKRTFNGIKDSIKSGIDVLKGINPLNLFRAAGGPVQAGQSYVVGEVGTEKFVGAGGIEKTIGAGGPEMFTPPTSGMVIPHHMLGVLDAAEGYLQSALNASQASANAALGDAPPKEENTTINNYTFNMPINNPKSEIDVKKAVKKALAEAEETRKERSTR